MASSSPESSMRGDGDDPPDHGGVERPAKRHRPAHASTPAGTAQPPPPPPPHRRQAACQPCRLRKVKCDKQRPACSICRVSGQDCEYVGDAADKISLETATATLLERFDQLRREFEGVKEALHATGQPTQGHRPTTLAPEPQPPPAQPPLQRSLSSIEPSRDFLEIPPHRASADTVLRWDIFQDRYPPNALIGGLFGPDSNDALSTSAAESPSADLITNPAGLTPLEDEQIPALVDRFLQNVHTKNPILDVEALVKHGRRCAEQGVGWDGRSCLVLLACALGSVAKPFDRPVSTTAHTAATADGSGPSALRVTSSRLYAKELQQGDSCFTLACRRLGSLKYSILGAQCHFFAGVYLMYTLRPVLSWHYFLHASIFCQVHLRMTHGLSGDFTHVLGAPSRPFRATDRKSRRLEQSLYWSCFKSECEFRVELPLQQSEISLGGYPDLFPSPPSPISAPESLHRTSPTASNLTVGGLGSFGSPSTVGDEAAELRQHAVRLCNEEESWYYYMTEIALRRIGNRIINTFFRQERSKWLDVKPLLGMAQEFEAQVSSWSAHLPPAMQHYETTLIIRAPHLNFLGEAAGSHVSRELSWAIDNRLLEMQTWLYQPFLYYLVHAGSARAAMATSGILSSHQPRISSLLNPFSPSEAASPRLGESLAEAGCSSLDGQDLAVLHSMIASGIECALKTIDVRSQRHRHHGLWFDLRSIMGAALVLVAVAKSGNAAWIPGGTETLWGPALSPESWTGMPPPIGGKIAKVLGQFDFWAGESPDLLRYKEVLESVVRDTRGS